MHKAGFFHSEKGKSDDPPLGRIYMSIDKQNYSALLSLSTVYRDVK